MQHIAVIVVGEAHEQEQAATALANLADNNDANKAAIAAAGGIPPLVRLLGSSIAGVQQHAARTLWYLARNDANKAAIAAAGVIPPLVLLLGSGSELMQEGAAWACGFWLSTMPIGQLSQLPAASPPWCGCWAQVHRSSSFCRLSHILQRCRRQTLYRAG